MHRTSRRRRLVVPALLAVTVIGGSAGVFIGCSEDDRSDPPDADGQIAIERDAGTSDGDVTVADATPDAFPDAPPPLDAPPPPDASPPPDAPPDAPVG